MLDVWFHACQRAPHLSDITGAPCQGDLCWPDGSPRTNTDEMLVFNGAQWESLAKATERRFAVEVVQ